MGVGRRKVGENYTEPDSWGLTSLRMLDQNGAPVDTAGESYNAVIIVEYELAAGTKISG